MKIGDVSMIINSSGGSGTTFAPRYIVQQKKMSQPDTKCARLNQQSLYFKGPEARVMKNTEFTEKHRKHNLDKI